MNLWDKTEVGKAYHSKYHKDRRLKFPEEYLWRWAKNSARKRNLAFEIHIEDIKIPAVCPVLGIPIELNQGQQRFNSPSIDRFDNSKGYIKDNINIISWRANALKSNGTLEELRKLLYWMESN